jgi:signal transduction histidine kinase
MPLPSAWSLPSALAALVLGALLIGVWRSRPPRPFWPALPTGLAGALLFALGDFATFFGTSVTQVWYALLVLYAGLSIAVAAFLTVALRFAEAKGEPFAFGRSRAFQVIPVVWAVLAWLALLTNPWHGSFLTPNIGSNSDYHALWYVFAAWGYGFLLGGFALYAWLAWRGRTRRVRSQAATMAAAAAILVCCNAVYTFALGPLPFDPTTLGLLATCAIYVYGVYRLDLFRPTHETLEDHVRQDPDGVLLLDDAGRLLHRNPAVDRWLGPSPTPGEPVIPALAAVFVQRERPEQPLSADLLAEDLLAEAQPEQGHVFRLRDRDHWMRVDSFPIRGRRGEAGGRSLHLRDATEFQRLVRAVSEQASALEAIISATDEGVLVHVAGEIRFANPQFHEIWRTPQELREARTPGSLLEWALPNIADRERVLATLARVEADPLARIADEIAMCDGRVLERRSVPLRLHGDAMGRVWRIRDVTEQRRTEEAVRRRQKLESLGVMAGGIAHDFNNLLVTVMGNAALARGEIAPGSAAREQLADIERAAERASELTRQLLAYAGKGSFEVTPVDVSEIVRDVMDLVGISIGPSVAVRVDLREGLPAVVGDASQLRQVVMNLVLNAADAIGEGEGAVAVSTRLVTLGEGEVDGMPGAEAFEPGKFVALRVADTGCGMDEATRERIFDPFFTTKFAGRGLGLAATLGIVRGHRGLLRVESEPGAGSELTVLLPASGEPARGRAETRAPIPRGLADATILVVDDDAAVRRVAERMLVSGGLAVVAAESGEEALEIYRTRGSGIDGVLMDLTMPGMGGEAACRALREIDPAVRVVLSSGYPEQDAMHLLDDRTAFVQKPYRTDAVLAIFGELLDAPGAR